MNRYKYKPILAQNIQASASKLKMERYFTFQQNNNPIYTPKSTKEWVNQKIKVFELPSQSSDLNPAKSVECPEASCAQKFPLQFEGSRMF